MDVHGDCGEASPISDSEDEEEEVVLASARRIVEDRLGVGSFYRQRQSVPAPLLSRPESLSDIMVIRSGPPPHYRTIESLDAYERVVEGRRVVGVQQSTLGRNLNARSSGGALW